MEPIGNKFVKNESLYLDGLFFGFLYVRNYRILRSDKLKIQCRQSFDNLRDRPLTTGRFEFDIIAL